MTTAWRLDHNTDSFNRLSVRDERYDFFPRYDGTPEFETWEPQYVWYHPLDFSEDKGIANFPSWGTVLVCDEKAKDIIFDLVKNCVEFLPLASHTITDTIYYAINTMIVDCLDYDRSEMTHSKFSKHISIIVKYEFNPDCITGIPIFKLPMFKRNMPFVTDEFKQLIEINNLTGLEFRKVWEG